MLLGFGIVGIVLGVGSVALFSSLTSSRKAAAVALAKTEGQYALRSMSDMIRFARKIQCAGGNNHLQVDRYNIDNNQESLVYRYRTAPAPARISSQSGTLSVPGPVMVDLTSNKVVVSVTDCGGAMFSCAADGRTVDICFVIDNVNGIDVTDKAMGTKGIEFRTRVSLSNLNN